MPDTTESSTNNEKIGASFMQYLDQTFDPRHYVAIIECIQILQGDKKDGLTEFADDFVRAICVDPDTAKKAIDLHMHNAHKHICTSLIVGLQLADLLKDIAEGKSDDDERESEGTMGGSIEEQEVQTGTKETEETSKKPN